jgi:phage FluMu protein Com
MIKKTDFVYLIMVIQQLICDVCKKVILEKEGESHLNKGEFPISNEEATMLDKEHRGHQCHIDVVEKL